MILETLAQYSAMMVLRERYSDDMVKQFLQLQYEDYLDGIRRQTTPELPLALVGNEEHIYYAKGAINMYALQHYIGEDQVNMALRNFIIDWHSFNNPTKPDRYATTKDLIQYFKDVSPESSHSTISGLLERVESIDTTFMD
jgi:ABC-2 type transport system permease protein